MNTKNINWHIVAIIGANLIWGAAVPIFKYSLGNIPPFILLFIRFFLAALLFLPFAVKNWQRLALKEYGEIIFASLIGFSVGISFLFMGLQRAPSINFPVIVSAGPIVLYCIAIFVMKEQPRLKTLMGSFVALCGVMFIVLYPFIFGNSPDSNPSHVQGNIFFIVAVIAQAICVVTTKTVLKKVNVFQTTFIMFAVAAVTYLPLAYRELATWSFAQLNGAGLFGIIYGTIFSSALAYFLYHWAIHRIDTQEIGVFAYLDPVTTVIVAFFLLGEVPTIFYLFGALLVFTGIFIAENRIHWHPLHKIRKTSS